MQWEGTCGIVWLVAKQSRQIQLLIIRWSTKYHCIYDCSLAHDLVVQVWLQIYRYSSPYFVISGHFTITHNSKKCKMLGGHYTMNLAYKWLAATKASKVCFLYHTQLHFGQWSSLPFYRPSLIVQWPARIFHLCYCAWSRKSLIDYFDSQFILGPSKRHPEAVGGPWSEWIWWKKFSCKTWTNHWFVLIIFWTMLWFYSLNQFSFPLLSPGQTDSQVNASLWLAFNLNFIWSPTCIDFGQAQIHVKVSSVLEIYYFCNLRELASWLVNPFGHPLQVHAQVLVL